MSATQPDIGSPTSVPIEGLGWYRAVTLSERLAGGLLSDTSSTSGLDEHLETVDDDRLQYCIASWKSQRPFDVPEYFQQRLELDHLAEADLRDLITERPARISRRLAAMPRWMATIEEALSQPASFEFHDLLTDRLKRNATIGFLDVAAPFINAALRQLKSSVAARARRSSVPYDPAAIDAMLFPSLASSLLQMVSRTMVLELNVARLEGVLSGESADARFASFIAQLHDPRRLRALLEEYPVLARLLAEQSCRWVEAGLEMLDRLTADVEALESAFAGGSPLGRLVGISSGLADPHDGGRSVAIATFGSGTRIVYKPKALAVDSHFQTLLQWLTAKGFAPGFQTLTIVDRGTYGWVTHASPAPCPTRDSVVRFYERAGGLLALLYVTEATDLHAGNVIASGEHPFLIDLEALFHPHRSEPVIDEAASADSRAARAVRASVLRIGLLPERLWGNEEHEGIDISGLGTPDGQTTPHVVPDWEQAGTDTMRLVRRRKTIAADSNRPVLDGRAVDLLDFGPALVRGFRSAYAILADRREELLSPEGPLSVFAHDPVAVFLRSSRTYRRLLRESYHPDVLRDALDRDRLFDLLWVEVPDDPALARVIRHESRDLWNGDIPCFSARPASRTLSFGAGETLVDFFPGSALASVRRIVDRLSESDGARQAWLIEASLTSLPGASERWPAHAVEGSVSSSDPGRLLAAALAVGGRLDGLAIRGQEDASWIGLDLLDRHGRAGWSISKAGLDLDAGVPGIAMFLAYLGAVTGHDGSSALARAALETMREQTARRASPLRKVGGFDGLGGVIYELSHLAALWGRADLASDADSLATRLPELIAEDEAFDVFSGAAGCILALRSLQRCRPSPHVADLAVQCGDHLLRSAERTADGIVWSRISEAPRHRTGLMSGTAGIALALFELHTWTGIQRFRTGAEDALKGDRQATTLSQLCGSPAKMSHPGVRADIAAAAAAIRDRGFGGDHSLDQGDLGSLELLERAAVMLEDTTLSRETERMAAMILADIDDHGWRCATPLGVETPGLLSGLAGIGYGLLRAARPDVVPSVLTLDPPIFSRSTHVD
jgi:type 2 lantibiotic biosynthesis protein LanM